MNAGRVRAFALGLRHLFPPGHVAILRLYGPIGDGARTADWIELVRRLRESKRVPAVVLDIDSPGGSATAADDMFLALEPAWQRPSPTRSRPGWSGAFEPDRGGGRRGYDRSSMPILHPEHVAFLEGTRRAVLATIAPSGSPRQVPVCFAIVEGDDGATLYSPLDEKPKRGVDPHELARVRDLLVRPHVSLLADRWDEDWTQLAWLRVEAVASLREPGDPEHALAIVALRARYRQYRTQALEVRPLIRLQPTRAVWWTAAAPPATPRT